jgi:hypothetical protein
MNFLKSIDTMGFPFTLSIKGNKKFKTKLGGLLTLTSIVCFLILFFLLGVNFYQRKNPTLSMSVSKPPKYFDYHLNSTSFIYAFRVENGNGELILRPDLFYYEPRYIVYRRDPTGLTKLVDKTLKYRQCEPEDVGNSTLWGELFLNRYLCMDYAKDWNETGLPVGGLYDSSIIQYIKIRVLSCFRAPSSYLTANNITCNSNVTVLKQFFSESPLFSAFIQQYNANGDDRENPFQVVLQNIYDTIDPAIYKKSYFFFKKGILNDYNGWLSEGYDVSELIGMDRYRYDFYTNPNELFKASFFETNLYFDKITETFKRRYLKIQELLASIGGILKSLTVIFGVFCGLYNQFYQFEYLINENFDIYDDADGTNRLMIEQISKNNHKKEDLHEKSRGEKSYFSSNQIESNRQTPNSEKKLDNQSKIFRYTFDSEANSMVPVPKDSLNNTFSNTKRSLSHRVVEKINLNDRCVTFSQKDEKNELVTENISRLIVPQVKKNLKPTKLGFTYWHDLKAMCCKFDKKLQFQENMFNLGVKIINKKLDCSNILHHIHHTENALKYLLDENMQKELKRNPILNLEMPKKNLRRESTIKNIWMAVLDR